MSASKGPRPEQGNAAPTNHALDCTQEAPAGQCRLLSLARRYVSAGLSVIPIKADGSKQPAFAWKTYTERMPTDGELVRWFGPYCGIGIVCGSVSGNLEAIDFDAPDLFEPWRQLVDSWAPGLVDRLLIVQTPRGGRHVLYRSEQIEGNQPLARRPAPAGSESGAKAIILIETRGEGGQILAPGCAPECHPTGGRYVFVAGPGYGSITTIMPDERAILLNAARSFNEYVPPQAVVIGKSPDATWTGLLRPGDDFNARASWPDVLEPAGWTAIHRQGDVIHWRRPGKTGPGSSATTGYCRDGDLFYVFSSNAAPFEPDRGFTKFAAYALLNHDGDFSATAKALAKVGWGSTPRSHTSPTDSPTNPPPQAPLANLTAPKELPRRFVPFPVEVLPKCIRTFVTRGAKAIGCDVVFLALPVLSVLAAAIGHSRQIRIKRTWTEPAIIWTGVVGESGTLKTPPFRLAVKALRRFQSRALKVHKNATREYKAAVAQHQVDLAAWKLEAARDAKNGGVLSRPAPKEPDPPICVRYVIDDVTVEALIPILQENPRGVILARDEIAGLFKSFDAYKGGKGGDRERFLSMHNGDSIFNDRKTDRATNYVPNAVVSMAGGIQPSILRRVMGHEERESGLLARVLMAMPPRKAKAWTEDELPEADERAYSDIVEALLALDLGVDDDGDPVPVTVEMTVQAKEAWRKFFNEHAIEHAELTGDLAAAWSKLEGYAARIALVIHMVRVVSGDPDLVDRIAVDEVSLRSAVTLTRWFCNETERIYAMLGGSPADHDRHRLLELIERKGGNVSIRELMRSSRAFKKSAEFEAALNQLVGLGLGKWVDAQPQEDGGAPSRRFVLIKAVDTSPEKHPFEELAVDTTPPGAPANGGSVNVNTVNALRNDEEQGRSDPASVGEREQFTL